MLKVKPSVFPIVRLPVLAGFTFSLLILSDAYSQQASSAQPGAAARTEGEVIELNPFVVSATEDKGYQAQSSLSGSRLRTNFKDMAAPTSAFTEQFFLDAGITNTDQLKTFMLSAETDYGEEASGQNRLATEGRQIRLRGLPGGNSSVNFFPLTAYVGGNDLRLDTFSLERAEQSRGPNSVLFGVGTPGGVINVTTKRANLNRQSGALGFKVLSYDGFRSEFDFNQPVLAGRLALRVAAQKENTGSWRNNMFNDTERLFATAKWQVAPRTEFNAEIEQGEVSRTVRRTFTAFDGYTPWLNAGANLSTAANAANFIRLLPVGTARTTVNTADGKLYNYAGTTATVVPTVDGLMSAVTDFNLLPRETVIMGPEYVQDIDYTRLSAYLTHSVGKNLNFELAGFHHDVRRGGLEAPQGNSYVLAADTSPVLPGGAPNPNAGRPFFEVSPEYTVDQTTNDYVRLSAAYEMDFGRVFGRHTLAGVYQLNHATSDRALSSQQILGNPYNVTSPENAANKIFYRTYVGRQLANGTWTLAGVPVEQIVLNDHRLSVVDNQPVIGNTAALSRSSIGTAFVRTNINNNFIRSQRGSTAIGVLQSRFWEERIQTIVGFNREEIDLYESAQGAGIGRQPLAGFTNGIVSPVGDTTPDTFEADNFTYSGIFHATKWLTFTYSKAENTTVANANNRLLGGRGPTPRGKSQDYGVKLDLWDGRVFLTALYFETSASPDADFGSSGGVLAANINPIWNALDAAGVLAANGLNINSVLDDTSITTFDSSTTGVEIELTANLTPQWRVFMNYSNSETKRTNIGLEMRAYLAENRAFWESNGSVPLIGGTGGTVVTQVAAIDTIAFQSYVLQDGRLPVGQTRDKLNFRTNYDFAEGRLKGFGVGGGVRYAGPRVLSYTPVAGTGGSVSANALRGEAQEFVDLNASYTRKFRSFGRSINWVIQLNVNNVLNNDEVVPIRSSSTGQTINYVINDPIEWSLSTRFSF